MKRILVMLMMLFIATGCGGKEIKELDLDKASQTIEKTLSNMEIISDETLDDVYDLDFDSEERHIVKQNSEGDMYAIIFTEDRYEMKEEMDAYFDKVRDFNTAYSPERVKLIDERLEKEIGNYLIYIVAENSESIYQDIINTME